MAREAQTLRELSPPARSGGWRGQSYGGQTQEDRSKVVGGKGGRVLRH